MDQGTTGAAPPFPVHSSDLGSCSLSEETAKQQQAQPVREGNTPEDAHPAAQQAGQLTSQSDASQPQPDAQREYEVPSRQDLQHRKEAILQQAEQLSHWGPKDCSPPGLQQGQQLLLQQQIGTSGSKDEQQQQEASEEEDDDAVFIGRGSCRRRWRKPPTYDQLQQSQAPFYIQSFRPLDDGCLEISAHCPHGTFEGEVGLGLSKFIPQ